MISIYDEQTGKIVTGEVTNISLYTFDLIKDGEKIGTFDISLLNKEL